MNGWTDDGIGDFIRTYCGKNAFANQKLPNIFAIWLLLRWHIILKRLPENPEYAKMRPGDVILTFQ